MRRTRIYQGAHTSDGTRAFQGYARGSELKWPQIWAEQDAGRLGWDFWRYSVFQDPNFGNIDFDYDSDTDRGLSTSAGQASASPISIMSSPTCRPSAPAAAS